MKLGNTGSTSSKEAASGQGPASEPEMCHCDECVGPTFAQELSAKVRPAPAVNGRSVFQLVVPALQRICGRLAKYGIQRVLGRGASGTVLLADDLKKGTGKVAIKVMKRMPRGMKNNQHGLQNELNILRHLASMDMGRLLTSEIKESFVDAYNYYIVMVRRLSTFFEIDLTFSRQDYYPGGDLLKVMSKYPKGRMPSPVLSFYAGELVRSISSF